MTTKLPKPKHKDGLIERYYHLDLFKADFFVLIGKHELLPMWAKDKLSKNRVEEFMNMYKETTYVSRGRQYPMDGGGSIIWVLPGEKQAYLVHELAHAATHLFRDKGIPITSDTDELMAYVMELLYERLT